MIVCVSLHNKACHTLFNPLLTNNNTVKITKVTKKCVYVCMYVLLFYNGIYFTIHMIVIIFTCWVYHDFHMVRLLKMKMYLCFFKLICQLGKSVLYQFYGKQAQGRKTASCLGISGPTLLFVLSFSMVSVIPTAQEVAYK